MTARRVFRVRAWLLALGVTVALVESWLALSVSHAELLPDLQVYRGALSQWLHDASLYDYRRANGDMFTYPPIAAFLLSWVTLGPYRVVCLMWTSISVVAIAGSAVLVHRRLGPATDEAVVRNHFSSWQAIFLALMVCSPMRSNLQFGQVSGLIFLLTLLGCLLPGARAGGFAVGLAAAVKLTPLAVVPFLWLGGRRRHAAYALAAFGSLTVLGAVLAPHDSWRYWIDDLPHSSRVVHWDIIANQSFMAFASRTGLPLTTGLIGACLVIIYLTALAGALNFAREGRFIDGLVTMGCAVVILSPISWTHHQFWLVLAAWINMSRSGITRAWSLEPGAWSLEPGAWRMLVLTVMALGPFSVHGPLGLLTANSHLLLATLVVVIAATRHRRTSTPPA